MSQRTRAHRTVWTKDGRCTWERRTPASIRIRSPLLRCPAKATSGAKAPWTHRCEKPSERGRRAALNNDVAGFEQAKNAAFSRLNALFYLASARYLNTSLEKAQASDIDGALIQLAEGYAFYLSIQPQVAKADPEADKTIVRYYTSSPSALTAEKRDAALAALNKAAGHVAAQTGRPPYSCRLQVIPPSCG